MTPFKRSQVFAAAFFLKDKEKKGGQGWKRRGKRREKRGAFGIL